MILCHLTILDSVITYPNELEVKDTTDTQQSASYLDLYMYLEINNERTLKTNLFDKCDNDFTFLTVNFPLIGSNIPAVTAYGVYNSQLHPLTAKLALLY